LTNQLAPCFKYAVEQGFDIVVTAQVDDGRESGLWRNRLKFDPQQRFNFDGQETFSFAEAVLFPIVDALTRAAKANTKVLI
jgi:hypothetical protein